jgi:hypothetical protein
MHKSWLADLWTNNHKNNDPTNFSQTAYRELNVPYFLNVSIYFNAYLTNI